MRALPAPSKCLVYPPDFETVFPLIATLSLFSSNLVTTFLLYSYYNFNNTPPSYLSQQPSPSTPNNEQLSAPRPQIRAR